MTSEFEIEPFRPEHFDLIALQYEQEHVRRYTTRDYLQDLADSGPAYTVIRGERVIFCGGLKEFSAQRGMLWSYIARDTTDSFVRLHRYVERFLGTVAREEILATCQTGFVAGARWLELLNFRYARSLGSFGRARLPHDLYVWVP